MADNDNYLGETLWAWVTLEPNGNISLVAAIMPGVAAIMPGVAMAMPLINRRRDVIERARPLARDHAAATGQKTWLRAFTTHVDYEEA